MASIIDISPACEDDFPTLAHIAPVAMGVDLLHRVMYEGNNPFDTSRQERFLMAELGRAALNPQAHIYKATTKSSREIVGYMLFRFDEGKENTPSGPSMASYPPGTNVEFMGRMSKGIRAAHSKHMGGKRHVCQSLFLAVWALLKEGLAGDKD